VSSIRSSTYLRHAPSIHHLDKTKNQDPYKTQKSLSLFMYFISSFSFPFLSSSFFFLLVFFALLFHPLLLSSKHASAQKYTPPTPNSSILLPSVLIFCRLNHKIYRFSFHVHMPHSFNTLPSATFCLVLVFVVFTFFSLTLVFCRTIQIYPKLIHPMHTRPALLPVLAPDLFFFFSRIYLLIYPPCRRPFFKHIHFFQIFFLACFHIHPPIFTLFFCLI
jgi:hypothetical protein